MGFGGLTLIVRMLNFEIEHDRHPLKCRNPRGVGIPVAKMLLIDLISYLNLYLVAKYGLIVAFQKCGSYRSTTGITQRPYPHFAAKGLGPMSRGSEMAICAVVPFVRQRHVTFRVAHFCRTRDGRTVPITIPQGDFLLVERSSTSPTIWLSHSFGEAVPMLSLSSKHLSHVFVMSALRKDGI
jgi:hypothetical protein